MLEIDNCDQSIKSVKVLNNFGKKSLLDFSISTGSYLLFKNNIIELAQTGRSSVVYFANVHMFIEAYKSKNFIEQINKADIVAPDGQPLTWMLKILYGIRQDRVAGMDLFPDLLKEAEKKQLSVFFYGGTHEMLTKTNDYIKQRYPNLEVAGLYSPPFRLLTDDESNEIIEKINRLSPAIVFVVLGCPRQEKWAAEMKGKINATMLAIGGALPVAIGMQKRAPVLMRKLGLEWLFRLFQEPQRLFKRYATTNSLFIWVMLKEFLRVRILIPLKISKS